MGEYASKGVAGSGLGLGIAGLSVALLQGANGGNGLLGGLFSGNNSATLAYIAEKDARIASLEAQKYTDEKISAVKERINQVGVEVATLALNTEKRVAQLEGQVSCLAQATNTAIAGINSTLGNITKCVIPAGAICPEVMPRYNSFVTPPSGSTTTPTA